MFRIISDERAEELLDEYDPWIRPLSQRYPIPGAVIEAILYMEMTHMDAMDIVADAVVESDLFEKKDSSTGHAQIFGYVGLEAANFALDRGWSDYASLGIESDHRLDVNSEEDVRLVWRILNDNPLLNIELAALNILKGAEEMTGRVDFPSYSETELKRVLTRYNAKSEAVTPYGEEAYTHYLRYAGA